MFLLLGAFIAGALTVLAPCVLPLLPIIIGGSVSGDTKDKRRPLVIAGALAASIVLFTLLLKVTTLLINVPPRAITYLSGSIIILLGIVTLFPSLYASVLIKLGIEHRAQNLLGKSFSNKRKLIGPLVTGAALGPVFSSCSPVYAYILATVLPVNFAQAFGYIIAYVVGLSAVLLLIGYYGQRFIGKIRFAANPKGWFQRIIAIVFIVVGLMIFTGADKRFQTFVSQHTPFNFDALSSKLLPSSANKINDKQGLFNVEEPYDAPEFVGLQQWINGNPQKMSELKGKVVLVDFWTYSCINCIRNNPYIEKWYEAYKDQGFEVIGVHAPEFSFEKVPANVQKAVKDQHITYPVALDNNFDTWNAYSNRSWPASYLIDQDGKVRRIHEGEGKYKESEEAIRTLLSEKGAKLSSMTVTGNDDAPISQKQTPETYLGSSRASNFAGKPALAAAAVSTFTASQTLDTNDWSLSGTWEVQPQKIIARGSSTLTFHIAAKDVYIVGGSATPKDLTVMLDGKPIQQTGYAGSDVKDGKATLGESKLYRLVAFPKFMDNHTLTLSVPDGVELNVFTFGS
jgi:cytochrome c biogenesis protein CcdA/thiol-disulfide isomerase/thioredoxin